MERCVGGGSGNGAGRMERKAGAETVMEGRQLSLKSALACAIE